MLNAGGIGGNKVAYGGRHQVEAVEPHFSGRRPTKFKFRATVLRSMHDFRFVKWKRVQQLGFIVEAELMNASSGKFEEILDNEA